MGFCFLQLLAIKQQGTGKPAVMLWSHKLKKYWMEESIYNVRYEVVEKQ